MAIGQMFGLLAGGGIYKVKIMIQQIYKTAAAAAVAD